MRIPPLWLAVFLLFSAFAVAQNQRTGRLETPSFRSRTELVTVPVVATRGGRHAPNLSKDDFTVFEDGRPKQIAFFEEIKSEQRIPRRPAPSDGSYSNEITEQGLPVSLTVILFDTLNTPFLYQGNGRQELVRFLSRSLTGQQLTMLLQLRGSGIKVLHDFTTSPAVLVAAVRRVQGTLEGTGFGNEDIAAQRDLMGSDSIGNATNVTRDTVALTEFMTEDPLKSSTDVQGCAKARVTLEAMQQLTRALGAIAGRKTAIWATGGSVAFPAVPPGKGLPPQGACSDLIQQYEQTWNLLSSANIAVYPIDLAQPENPVYASPKYRGPTRVDRPIVKQFLFDSFTDYTGGKVCSFRNDLDTCFKKAVEDSSEYYMLSYYATPLENPGWRKLQVKTRAQGVHLRARSGYFSLGTTDDPEARRKMDVALAIVSPVEYTGLPFTVKWTSVGGAGEKRKYGFELHVAPKGFAVDETDGNHVKFNVVAVAQDTAGNRVGDVTQELDTRLKPENLRKVLSAGVRYANGLELPPGRYRVRFILRDALTGRMGTVTVPLNTD